MSVHPSLRTRLRALGFTDDLIAILAARVQRAYWEGALGGVFVCVVVYLVWRA